MAMVVAELPVKQGDRVKAGDLLVGLEAPELSRRRDELRALAAQGIKHVTTVRPAGR